MMRRWGVLSFNIKGMGFDLKTQVVIIKTVILRSEVDALL